MTVDSQRRMQRIGRWTLAALTGLALLGSSRPAAAWDPSTTHQALLESALTRSAMHLHWMDASGMQRGVFSPLRLDPDRLTPAQRRLLQRAMNGAHADSGARPLGGPGSCPSASAPIETQLFCVDRDVWEHSALGWIRFGMVAEVTPSARQVHHFLDREALDAASWSDREMPPLLLRTRQARSNGEPRAGVATQSNFDGKAPSALAWLEDPDDPLAPPQTFAHLALASTAETKVERDHELALALIGVGALLHVTQDLAVPAHARGDVSAFFAPLSPAAGDRGLPFQEFVRVEYGRSDLPGIPRGLATTAPTPTSTPTGVPLATTLVGHLIGEDGYAGVAGLAARRFLSESSVPRPKFLDDTLSASEAARVLLGDDHGLAPSEVEGATLSPWPAQRGYLLSPTGRALAAFDSDLDGRIRPYLDETCYRDAAAILLPAAAEATRSILDLLWPAWPATRHDGGGGLVLTLPDWSEAKLTVLVEDPGGTRRVLGRHALEVSGQTQVDLQITGLAETEHVVLLLEATPQQGPPIILEQRLDSLVEREPEPEPVPELEPELEPEPVTTEPEDTKTKPEPAVTIDVQPFER